MSARPAAALEVRVLDKERPSSTVAKASKEKRPSPPASPRSLALHLHPLVSTHENPALRRVALTLMAVVARTATPPRSLSPRRGTSCGRRARCPTRALGSVPDARSGLGARRALCERLGELPRACCSAQPPAHTAIAPLLTVLRTPLPLLFLDNAVLVTSLAIPLPARHIRARCHHTRPQPSDLKHHALQTPWHGPVLPRPSPLQTGPMPPSSRSAPTSQSARICPHPPKA
ncbi:hypothetical protein AcV5_002623 [Taiwanofungus camphoratus]|nr:hypothetical protein AcV5_002623 [Antrodia cinnamomea]